MKLQSFLLTIAWTSAILTVALPAQSIVLKDGKTVTGASLRRAGESVMTTVQIGTGKGEVGYPIASIARIEFPEPPQLKAAQALIAEGKSAQALQQIEPVLTYYVQFRSISGSWWAQAQQQKISAFMQMKREREAEPLIEELMKYANDPQLALAAKIPLAASLLRQGDTKKALETCDSIIQTATQPETLAEVWLIKGDARFAEKDFESALLAYLHVPVFFPEQTAFLPPAALGAARSHLGLEDTDRTKETLSDLITVYPNSAAATEGKALLAKLTKSTLTSPSPTPSKP